MLEKDFCKHITALGGEAYLVGGFVRDMLLNRPSNDRDYVVCGLNAPSFEQAFATRRVGKSFPVYLLEIDGALCEIALARTERKTGRGYLGFEIRSSPDVTIEEDLYRRDTKMNAIALRLSDRALIDPFGGKEDISNRTVDAVSPHFRDDPVRSLRAARQAAQLNFIITSRTSALMKDCAAELRNEPGERIGGELLKALECPNPEIFFIELDRASLLEAIIPVFAEKIFLTEALDRLRRAVPLSTSPCVRFAAMTAEGIPDGKLKQLLPRLALPGKWFDFTQFIRTAIRIQKITPAEAFNITEKIAHRNFSPEALEAAFQAVTGNSFPLFRYHSLLHLQLKETRKRLVFPPSLAPHERSSWYHDRLTESIIPILSALDV